MYRKNSASGAVRYRKTQSAILINTMRNNLLRATPEARPQSDTVKIVRVILKVLTLLAVLTGLGFVIF